MADITRIGREHLATVGAAALSLRAVARDLGVVSSAVYRYVASRDDLLTLLVVDGYTELADTVDAAVARRDDPREQFFALGRAVRTWALAEPARYGLLFGSPVPGYQAPGEQTTTPGIRVVLCLLAIVQRALQAGALVVPADAIDPKVALDVQQVRSELGIDIPDAVFARGALVWPALFGTVNFEVFGQYGADNFAHRSELFDQHLAVLAEVLGFRSTAPTTESAT